MIGFLAYIPTVAFVPHLTYVLIFIYIFIKKGKNMDFGSYSNLAFFLLIIIFSILNNLLHPIFFEKIKDYIPFLILSLISLLAAKHFTKNDAKVLIYFIAFESVIVIIESILGISTFFKSLPTYLVYENSALLYFNRPFGLSTNSSAIALKILIALTLIKYYKFKGGFIKIAYVFILIACILTFNRTVLVTLFFFYSLGFITNFYNLKFSKIKLIFVSVLFVLLSVILMIFIDNIIDVLVNQFTRNSGKLELTGREAIWSKFLEFIQQNFFWGNGSFKYFIETYTGHKYHAHNSYLEVMATHGFFIFLFYILLIIKNINKHNFIFVLTFLVYSLSQYGVFWGVSLMDIVFLFYLFSNSNEKIDIAKTTNKTINYG